MNDPHDDTDVLSGSTDGAQMESTSSPVPREHFGAAATKHFESASTSERNQRAAEQRVGVPASPFVYEWGHGGGESGTTGDPSECRLDPCSR